MTDHKILHAAEGALGGLAGALVLRQGMRLFGRLPESLRPPEVTADPGEHVVSRAEEAVGRSLPEPVHRGVARGLAFGYGALGPALLGLLAAPRRLREPRQALLCGAALGSAVFAASYLGWLPAMGLARPVHRQPFGRVLAGLAGHLLYGTVAVLPLFACARTRRAGLFERLRGAS